MAVLKFFDMVLKFELPTARFLNFPKNSAAVLIRSVLIIGDCVYVTLQHTAVIYGAESQRKCGIPLLVIKGGPSQKEKRLRLNDD